MAGRLRRACSPPTPSHPPSPSSLRPSAAAFSNHLTESRCKRGNNGSQSATSFQHFQWRGGWGGQKCEEA